MIQINLSALTDTGIIRDHNEDNFIVSPDLASNNWFLTDKPVNVSAKGSLLVVADGMGGTNAGEVASAIAVESIKKFFTALKIQENPGDGKAKDILKKAIVEAHDEIVNHARINPAFHGMGTTIIVAWILQESAVIAWCGDSRGYLFRPGEGLKIVTKDHSLVWELVKSGRLTQQEADLHPDNNIITQSLGDINSIPKPDFIVLPLQNNDILLLCSDGLNNMITTEVIGNIIAQEKSLPKINKELIEAANKNGGHDNITAVLLQVCTGRVAIEQKSGKKFQAIFMLLVVLAFIRLGAGYYALKNKKSQLSTVTDTIEVQKIQVAVKEMPAPFLPDSTNLIKEENAETVSEKPAPAKEKASSKQTVIPVPPATGDTSAQINQRIRKIEVLLKDWKQLSLLLDSIQEHQSQRHIDTLKTAILFELINRQREFEEYIGKYKFVQKVDDWKAKENVDKDKLFKYYNPKKLDEELQNAQLKYDHIQKSLNKITSKV